VQLAEQAAALAGEHGAQRAGARAGRGDQLEVELVAVAGRGRRRLREPALELLAPRVGDRVDDAVGPARLRLGAGDDAVPFALETLEHLVEVADVERAPLRPGRSLECALELVPVALAAGEQGEDGVVERHRRGT